MPILTCGVSTVGGNVLTTGDIWYQNTANTATITTQAFNPTYWYPWSTASGVSTGINWDITQYVMAPAVPENPVARMDREYREKQIVWLTREKTERAEKRAEELLLMCLPEHLREQYLKHGYFDVNTPRSRYRINRGFTQNVELLDKDGRPMKRLCIHPEIRVPNADNMLAQKLMLETNEAEFLRLANSWPV